MGKTTAYFQCRTCEDKPSFDDAKTVFDHLRQEHGFPPGEKIEGTRQMVSHMDGKNFSASTYCLQFGSVLIYQYMHTERGNHAP
jgi:hypothetical protein